MIDGMDEDDRLLRELANALARSEPIPDGARLAARSAIAWRRMDAELAEMLGDSATAPEPAATRAAPGIRTLTFATPSGVSIDIEVSPESRGNTVLGLITPAGPATVILRRDGGAVTVGADDLGRFRAEAVPPGPLSVRVERPGQTPVETGWTTI